MAKPPTCNYVVRFIKYLFHELLHDNLVDNGAMMAYYAILALFPMIVFIVTVGLLVLPDQTLLQGLGMATQAMPSATRELVTTQVTTLMETRHAGFAIGGATLALWGASRGMNSLMGALNAMFNTTETRPWWKRQVIAISMTLGVTSVVIAALGLLVVGPLVGHWIVDRFGLGGVFDWLWAIGHWVGAGILVLFVWAALYKFLPNTDKPFKLFSFGAVTAVILWLVISFGFGFYLSHFNSYSNTYGALGGGIIFLTWLWLSAISLLFGAEINDVIDHMRTGTAMGEPVDGAALASVAHSEA
ncbi:MAG TPA: YihY/virulence factor BrkB family protein [Kofleriaceae bacterium]